MATSSIPRIALVNADAFLLKKWADYLASRYDVRAIESPTHAHRCFESERFDVVILDLDIHDRDGLWLLKDLRRSQPASEAIIVSDLTTADVVVSAMRHGASDFLCKPIESMESLGHRVEEALARVRTVRPRAPAAPVAFDCMLHGDSPSMQRVRTLIARFATSDLPVMLLGASGTGKEVAARALHASSGRADKPFVAINCAGLSESLIDSELFGYERGAFTGANAPHKGLFDTADGGTLFLDEIGDVPPHTQVRLLRTLQEGEVRPVGANRCHHVDVRVISATNIEMKRAIEEEKFRLDLYFRLSPIKIELPPLRERGRDVLVLAEKLITACAERARRRVPTLSASVCNALLSYEWPGNVRELKSAVEYALSLSRSEVIEIEDLPPSVADQHHTRLIDSVAEPSEAPPPEYMKNRKQWQAEFDRRYFEQLLRYTHGNLSEASRYSGVDRSNLRRILKDIGLDACGFRPGSRG